MERLEEIVFHDLNFHVLANVLVELILSQECVGTSLEVFESVMSPVLDDGSGDFSIDWELAANFNDKIFSYFNHLICILSRRNFVGNHKTLNLLDGHRVEKHTHEL